jgi:LysM repeat protein
LLLVGIAPIVDSVQTRATPVRASTRRLAAIVLGITALASCSGSEASIIETTSTFEAVDGFQPVDTASTSTALSYTINSGDTLTGIAERAGVSLADLVSANAWPDGSDHLIRPGDRIVLPGGATVPSPPEAAQAGTTATPTTTSAVTASAGGYEPSEGPRPSSIAANQKSDPIVVPLPDGQYWSWDYTSDGAAVSLTLVQYFVGDACREQFGDSDDACASDNNTLSEPSTTVQLSPTADTSVVACCNDSGQFESYRVSTSEFARLVAGLAPAPDAPTDFTYGAYGVVVDVQNGQAVSAQQIFTS